MDFQESQQWVIASLQHAYLCGCKNGKVSTFPDVTIILGADPRRSPPNMPYDTKRVEGGTKRASSSMACARRKVVC